MYLKRLPLDPVHFLVRRTGPDAAEEVAQEFSGGVEWSKAERRLGLLGEGVESAGVAGQVLIGQLKGEDHEAGNRAVEPAAGDSGHHLGEGALDGRAIHEAGQMEGGQSWLSPGCTRAARGVVVEAELLVAEGGRTAATAGGQEVVAGWTGCGHGGSSLVEGKG
jgi:hypothetical protein